MDPGRVGGTFRQSVFGQVEDLQQRRSHPRHHARSDSHERAPDQPAIIDGPELIDQGIRVPLQVLRRGNPDPERFGLIHQACRERRDEGRRMPGVKQRLERLGCVEARWATAESGRRRRYYRVTQTGRTHLATQRQQWQVVDATLRGIWRKATPAHALG